VHCELAVTRTELPHACCGAGVVVTSAVVGAVVSSTAALVVVDASGVVEGLVSRRAVAFGKSGGTSNFVGGRSEESQRSSMGQSVGALEASSDRR